MGTPKETHLQSYLKHWKDPSRVTEEFGINVYEHPTLPLLGFKYSQLDSPKLHPIVRSARGTVLEKSSYSLVAQPFFRFYNFGECIQEMDVFNWNDFTAYSKEDGSLQILYYYNNEWHVNTSGSFGLGEIASGAGKTWREVFFETLRKSYVGEEKTIGRIGERSDYSWFEYNIAPKLNKKYSYIWELCTGYNKIVRSYPEHKTFLLGVFNIENDPYEFDSNYVDYLAEQIGVLRPIKYHFTSFKQIEEFMEGQERLDPTYEGIVIKDNQNIRFKIKSKTYLGLAHIKDNGNIFNPKRIIPWVISNNQDELITYFPELKDKVKEVKDLVDHEYNNLVKVWQDTNKISDQKAFALSIKDKTKFSGLLFTLRKEYGQNQTKQDLNSAWRNSADAIVKYLF